MSSAATTRTTPSRDFWDGVKAGLPVVVASAPFALLFGALAAQQGLSAAEATAMSVFIFAGASQMVGIELFGQSIPPWAIVMSILAVNFRHVLYSAAIGPLIRHWSPARQAIGLFFLTDPAFAESEARAARLGNVSFVWFMGMSTVIYVPWVIETTLGALFGNLVPNPHALGLDFLLPLYFIGLVMGFRSRPLWLPVVAVSAVTSILAMKIVGSPWHVSIGAAAGILLAAALPPRLSTVRKS